MRVLVTGSRGFLGSHLAAELRRARPSARLILSHRGDCDLRDPAAVRRLVARAKPAVVFHLAGTTKAAGWDGLWEAHVGATINLLDALSRLPGRARVIICGSGAEYGDTPGRTNPVTAYGATKLSQTLAALSYAGSLDVVAARVFGAIGPGMPENLALGSFARQVARILRGEARPTVEVGNLAARRDFVDVRDVARAFLLLGAKGRPGQVYDVGTGRSRPVGDLLKALIAASGEKIAIHGDPGRRRSHDVADSVADVRKLSALGWRPRIAFERSVADALAWAAQAR